jgi:N-acetylglucosaminyldiphosphoundecaprenol N-acetyl-beta-D-mannosaminyltransferase
MDKILGVRIDNLSRQEILEKTESFLLENKFHQIATIGPEFILRAQKDERFKNILNSCDLNIADGAGISFAFLRFGKFLKYRMAGVDLMMEILKMAEKRGMSVFLAIRKDGLSSFEETKKAILKKFPRLEISGENFDISNQNYISEAKNYNLVFCNFGAPYQENFLNSLKDGNIKLARLDLTRLAMGVGGSFDFLTGKIRRAPKIMRLFGFEWLWRLFRQPNRWKRIRNAVIIFPIKVILCKEE